jgi:hypothetical protein
MKRNWWDEKRLNYWDVVALILMMVAIMVWWLWVLLSSLTW